MSWYGNDGLPTQGELNARSSPEAIKGLRARPDEPDRGFRDAGWWPSGGTALRVVLIAVVLIVGLGWALTLLK